MRQVVITTTITIAIVAILAINSTKLTANVTPNLTNPIRLGSILILSGEGSSWGTAEQNGMEIAIEKVNSEGGINGRKIIVEYEDDKGDPSTAVNAFRKLVDEQGINIIIGTTWSRTGLPLAQLANSKKIIMISPSLGVREFNEQSRFLFNVWPHDYLLSERLADLVYDKGYRNVAVIGAQEVWVKDQANAFTKRFRELNGTISLLFEPDPSDRDMRTEALKIKDSNVDAIVFLTDGVQVGTIMAQRIAEQGIDKPSFSVTLTQDDITAARGAYDGTIFLTSLTPSKEFEQAYRQRYSKDLEIGGDSAYDAVMLLAKAMRATNSTDTETLQQYLNSVKAYSGVSGNLTADGGGGFTKPYRVERIVNGTQVEVDKV